MSRKISIEFVPDCLPSPAYDHLWRYSPKFITRSRRSLIGCPCWAGKSRTGGNPDISLIGQAASAESTEGKVTDVAVIASVIVTSNHLKKKAQKQTLQKVPQRLHNINQRQE